MSRIRMIGRVFISLLFTGLVFIAAESRGAESLAASLSVKADTDRNRDKKQTVEQKGATTVTTVVDSETETCTLEIEVGNSSDQNGNFQIEWYFIAKRTSAKGADDLVVFDSGRAPVILAGGASTVKKTVSKPFVFTIKDVEGVNSVTTSSGTGSPRQTRGGDEYAGYIVLVRADGEILEKASNTSRFLKDEWIEKCAAFAPKAAPKKKK